MGQNLGQALTQNLTQNAAGAGSTKRARCRKKNLQRVPFCAKKALYVENNRPKCGVCA